VDLRTILFLAAAVFVLEPAVATPTTCPKDYPAEKDREMQVLDVGSVLEESVDDISELMPEQRAIVERAHALLASQARIADVKDIQIIDRARQLLANESDWNRRDDRSCPAGATKVSLFCALQLASRDVTGEYRHRRTALEEVRLALESATLGRKYEHRLMDFNNDPQTQLNDIWAVLAMARSKLVQRLELQKACRL
jgi:hypothetical protein